MQQPTPHSILLTSWQKHQAELSHIRTCVFMHEQHISAADEWDGLDEQALHFLVVSATGQPLGCARVLIEHNSSNSAFHIGRVAILKPYRNQGIGYQLMQYVSAYCRQTNPENKIYLHAQVERRHFYESLNFKAEGDEFMDADIPHISMYLAS